MAVQIETQGQLAEFLEILSRRRWQLLLPALVVLAFGTALAVFIPKKFLVATQVEVRPVSVNLSGKEADNAPNQLRSIERIRSLVQTLKYAPYLVLGPGEQAQFVNDARGDLKVTVETPSRASAATSSFVRIEYTHADVNWAMEFLKALRDDWKKDVIDAEKNRVDDEAARQEEKVSQLEAQIKHEEDELNGLYQRNNISPTQPIPGGNEQRAEDPDFERLQRAKDKLWQEQNDLTRAEQRVAQLEVQLANEPEKLSEEQLLEGVNTSAELVGIEKDIVDLNAELARYRPQHSNYLQILKKIEDLEKKRDAIRRVATKNELTSVAKVNPHYTDLRQQLEAARSARAEHDALRKQLEATIQQDTQNVDELYLVYKEIRWRSNSVKLLQDRLAAATLKRDEKVTQARALASRLNDPFSVLQEVQKPSKPTEPNPWLIVAFALVAGLSLGLALALSAEYGRNCFRSVHDISRVMVAPVLGSVGRILTSRQRRLRALRRALVGALSAGVIASLAFVTWAWARNPELLSPQLRARIEQLRDKLR
jgi:capsular polysaccharide biosynthesis protein